MPRPFQHLDDTNRYVVEDHCANPRYTERVASPTVAAELDNPFCGDYAMVELAITDGALAEVCVVGTGCVLCQSSASMMAEIVRGQTLAEVSEHAEAFRGLVAGKETTAADDEKLGDAVALAGVARFPVRVKCALLPWATLEDALAKLGDGD